MREGQRWRWIRGTERGKRRCNYQSLCRAIGERSRVREGALLEEKGVRFGEKKTGIKDGGSERRGEVRWHFHV